MAEGHPSQRIHPGSIRADQGEGRRSLPTVANRGEGGGGGVGILVWTVCIPFEPSRHPMSSIAA